MKFVCSIDEGFLVYGVSQGHILLHFFLPLNYQLPIMAVPEVMVGWLTYLQDNLACPFEAECIEEMKISPLHKGEKITVIELIDANENLGGDFFILIEWMGRKMGVPLAQLKLLKTDKETKQAVEDWQYWKARGYLF